MMRNSSGILKAVSFLLIMVVCAVLILKVLSAVLLTGFTSECKVVAGHGYPGQVNPRNASLLEYSGGITFNVSYGSAGFRGRDYPEKKPEGIYRIAVLGDSYVFGQGLDDHETLPAQLEGTLNADGRRYEVLNLGVRGYNTLDEVRFFEERGTAFSPDAVIIGYLEHNDAIPSDIFSIRSPVGRALISMLGFVDARSCNAVIRKIEESRYTDFNVTPDDVDREVISPLKRLHELSLEHNFSIIIMMYDQKPIPESSIDHAAVESLAANLSIRQYNTYEAYAKEGNGRMWISDADMHPSAYANRIFAARLAAFFNSTRPR